MATTDVTGLTYDWEAQDKLPASEVNAHALAIEYLTGGYEVVDVAGAAGTTIVDTTVAKSARLKCTGALTGNRNVQLPSAKRAWIIWNASSGAFTLTFKDSGGTGIVVTQGSCAILFWDGTNMQRATPDLPMSPTTLTQTFATADATHAARTQSALTDNVAGTPGTTLAAIPDPADTPASADALRDDLVANVLPKIRDAISSLSAQLNAARVDSVDTASFVNSITDILQAAKLAG